MIVIDDKIIAPFIIITMIVRAVLRSGLFLVATCANVIDRGVIKDLLTFVLRKILRLIALQDGYRYLLSKGTYDI